MSGPVRKKSRSSADPLEVGREHGRAVAAGEAKSRLRARVRHLRDRELPGHGAGEAGDLVDRHVGDHARPAGGHREEVVVDHDDRLESDAGSRISITRSGRSVGSLEDGHGEDAIPSGAG